MSHTLSLTSTTATTTTAQTTAKTATRTVVMTAPDLAQVLFASRLQASDDPSPEQVRKAIDEGLCACDGDHTRCAAYVAQEAGDHPEAYAARMRWALRAIRRTFQPYATAA